MKILNNNRYITGPQNHLQGSILFHDVCVHKVFTHVYMSINQTKHTERLLFTDFRAHGML